ncbi:unnamed protein product [Somion occarium]|uniref:POP1-domain-containing protein n=1 Tax=Somion occarium TaxID=3059160 RepID=A0ABP1DYN4_9APHY
MASKRKGDESHSSEMTGRERKKQKTAMARTIAVQPIPGGSGSGSGTPRPQTVNVAAGPSKGVRFENVKQLPGSLDVERFAEARAFEINAMHNAMLSARDSATQRAWQQLPRHLRRRAASHDVRRVPLRLRDKARAEMDSISRKKKSLPKRGKAKRLSRTETFLKRQKDKTWLETHLWHAKRMKMENMWGYRLAVQPTEKAFRPSHRAAVHGSILHDASYHGFIELKGPEDVLRTILESCCDAQGPSPGAKRFLTGARACDTHFYKRGAYPFELIAPVTIIWQPIPVTADDPHMDVQVNLQSSEAGPSKGRKRKGKSKEKAKEKESDSQSPSRRVWLKVHPSVFHDVYVELRDATSFALEAVKKAAAPGDPACVVEMADLRNKLNVFEIMGPKASQVIRGALRPVLEDIREDFKKFWETLGDLQTTASLPRNMVIGMKVNDPRLTFPPKNAKVHLDMSDPSPSTSAAAVFPTSVIAQSEIWDEKVRNPLQKPRYKKKDLDERRSKNAIPGTPLQAIRQDDCIPIMLIQRSVEPPASPSTSTNHLDSLTLHGWTLILPAGWAMPFFSSLTYTGTRVSGQRERAAQYFEASRPSFPRDYPATEAYNDYAEGREDEERERWERKPPAKRVNYAKLGIRSPFRPDWGVVLGLESSKKTQGEGEGMDESEDLIPAQREEHDPNIIIEPHPNESDLAHVTRAFARDARESNQPRSWLLQGPAVPAALEAASSMFIRSSGLLQHLNALRAKRHLGPLDPNMKAEDIWKVGLIMVKLRMCGRGKPEDMGVIYKLTDDEWKNAINMEQQRKRGIPILDEDDEEGKTSSAIPPESSIIGYITAGNFSLSLGEGHAIGCIPLSQLFDIKELGHGGPLLVHTRNREGLVCRVAYLDVLDS